MVKVGQNATVYRGNRKILRFTIVDADNSNSALNVTTYTLRFAATITSASGDPVETAAVIQIDSTNDPTQVVKTDAANGIVDVILVAADTSSLNPGEYYMELEGVDASSNTEVLATGTLTVEPNVENA